MNFTDLLVLGVKIESHPNMIDNNGTALTFSYDSKESCIVNILFDKWKGSTSEIEDVVCRRVIHVFDIPVCKEIRDNPPKTDEKYTSRMLCTLREDLDHCEKRCSFDFRNKLASCGACPSATKNVIILAFTNDGAVVSLNGGKQIKRVSFGAITEVREWGK